MSWQPNPVWFYSLARGDTRVVYVENRQPVDLSKLIACITCRATVLQSCRTKSGHTTTPHDTRVAPRLCRCGALLKRRERYCRPCSAAALQQSKNEHGARRRAMVAA